MDAFYASVEQLDNPALKGKPIAVGGSRERGVVAAASYEARKFGIKSAMSSKIAAKKCPELIFVPPRFERYKEISNQIRAIFFEYTDLVEPLSLDEAYLDVTENKKGIKSATVIAQQIKDKIKTQIGLTASAGVSVNKFLAKIASDYQKPNGLFVIKPHQVEQFINQLPIEKFYGVGKVTAQKMHKMAIFKGADLLSYTLSDLQKHFGKSGIYYYNIVRGIDNRLITPERIRKSLGAETTFEHDLKNLSEIREQLFKVGKECWRRYQNSHLKAFTLTVKVKYSDFQLTTKSKTCRNSIVTEDEFFHTLNSVFLEINFIKSVRLLGCSLSNFVNNQKLPTQLTLEF